MARNDGGPESRDTMPLFVLHHLRPPADVANRINHSEGTGAAAEAVQRAMLSGDAGAALALGFYRPVATIRCASLEDLFRRTNHIDADWTEGPGVLDVAHPCRSTSVGDLAFSLAERAVFICAIQGWRPLTDKRLADQVIHASHDFLDRLSQTQRS